jgi:hypothetical protein
MNIKDITVIIPTSVIPSHPDTVIIEETINSIRAHLPDNEIIIQVDGLRNERLEWKDRYDEYKNRLLWKSLHEWKNVLPIIFDQHLHQTDMMRQTIHLIRTSAILYVESDTPLTTDLPIDWQSCLDMLDSGKANTVRFHFEAGIPEPHQYLMLGVEDGFMKTIQWSQRPHLSTVPYYKDVVLKNVPSRTFIEDTFHSYVQSHQWEHNKLWIYYPNDGENIKRSYHLDGRNGTRKFTSDDNAWGYTE